MDRFGKKGDENGQADDLDDLGDDMFGGDDDDDDVFDGEDDLGDFGGDEDESSVAEIEHRVDEMESELGRISSTVGTIKSENEEIRESVTETQENVRKLLGVYEMVTRGVNPFVDEDEEGGPGASGFGLFGPDEEETEEIDDELAGADAEGFFDEEFDEETDEDELTAADVAAAEAAIDEETDEDEADEDGIEESLDEAATEENEGDEDEADAPADGVGFDDLMAEYGADDVDANGDLEDADDEEPPAADASELVDSSEGDRFSDSAHPESEREPYLTDLGGGYAADPVVLEWLGYLVETAGGADAIRAIGYYETIDWVSAGVADRLRAFLSGFAGVETGVEIDEGPKGLGIEHHMRSLAYVSLLASDAAQAELIDRWSASMTARREGAHERGREREQDRQLGRNQGRDGL